MRQPNLQSVFSLIVLIAVPLLGCGGQAHAGMLIAEIHSSSGSNSQFGTPAPWGEWAEQQDAQSCISLRAIEPVIEQTAESAPSGPLHDPVSSRFVGLGVPGLPGVPVTASSKGDQPPPVCFVDRPELVPSDSPALFLSGARTRLPDPHLTRLFRPPR